ncbi:DUF4252 domain-containing protein [Chitinophaga silvatica]|nr:DUF4252 domain-containing protein [Chitinophaga silvatica]
MKKYIIALGCLLGVATTQAQTKSIKAFKEKYKNNAETQTFSMGGLKLKLLSFCLTFDDSDDATTVKNTLDNVRKVKIYTISNSKGSLIDPQDITDLKNTLRRNDHFDMLMEVRDKENLVQVLNKSNNDDELGNVVMLVQDQNDFVIVNLETTLKISDVNKLVKQFASNN